MNKELQKYFDRSRISDNYRRVSIDGKEVRFSHIVWNFYNPNNQILKGDGFIIHHRDKNRLNDSIENLEKFIHNEHNRLHMKNRIVSKETRDKISKVNIGKKHLEETKKKMSNSHKGIIFSEEHRKNISIVRKGIIFSEETKKKMSEARKKYCSLRKKVNNK